MGKDSTRQGVLFKDLSKKTLVARFDQEQSSSDGGAILLKACDERLGLSAAMAACLCDDRQQAKVAHSYEEIFQQRMFAIACGYADGNDAARLADDPVFKLRSLNLNRTKKYFKGWMTVAFHLEADIRGSSRFSRIRPAPLPAWVS